MLTEQKGQLVRWNEARGFGFIRPEIEGEEVFIHIKTLNKMARAPVVGDIIYFQSMADEQGKERAYSARIDGVALKSTGGFGMASTKPQHQQRPSRQQQVKRKNGGLSNYLGLIVMVVAGIYFFPRQEATPPSDSAIPVQETVNSSSDSFTTPKVSGSLVHEVPVINPFEDYSGFRCEGKQHCREMSSCKEARFYLRHCPGVKIDGDNDGIPCEKMCRPRL